ncbi:MAG TPA: DUF484 family protein [Dongiaceae bacterium]|nr:DUF484 family protein [Dongiaceae bacterium]
MTELTASKTKSEKLTAADVTAFLRAHPDFFVNRADLLFDLQLPHGHSNASSLLEKQASVLRTRNTELRHKLNELVNVARDNDRLFNQIRKLGLALLETDSLAQCEAMLQQSLLQDFHLDCTSLLLFGTEHEPGKIIFTSKSELQAILGDLLRAERIICTTLRRKEMAFLFPGYEPAEGSAALIPLHFRGEIGLLAVGSTDPNHYTSNMDTTFASYIGEILSRRLYHLLS